MLLLTGSRASFRLMTEFIARRHQHGQRLIVYGAGNLGPSATRELVGARLGATRLLGFIDDDPAKRGRNIQGYPVLGGYEALIALIRSGSVDSIVMMTDQPVDAQLLERLEVLCFEHGVALSRLRVGLEELIPSE